MAVSSQDELMRRRGELVARSRHLREAWAVQAQALRSPLGMADKARAGMDWLVRNPQWPLAALAVVLVVRPKRTLRLVGLGWSAWGLYRRTQRLMSKMPVPLR